MTYLLWAVAAVWVLFLVNTILNLVLVPHLVCSERSEGETPRVSVIIPARNEQSSIEETVRRFAAQSWRAIEIIVVDDRSTDSTGAILARLSREFEIVTHVEGVETPEGWLGKPWALEQGARAASGDVLLFADADVHYAPDAVQCAVGHLLESRAAAVSLFPHFEMHGFWENVLMPQLTTLAFIVAPLWLSNRTRMPFLAMGGGPGNFVLREAYERAGGHEPLKNAVVDDIGLIRLLRAQGERTLAARAERMVSIRMYRGLGEIVGGFTKNAFKSMDVGVGAVELSLLLLAAGHLLPYVVAIAGLVEFAVRGALFPSAVPALVAVALIALVRSIVFAEFRYPLRYALIGHPFMTAGWMYIIARSTWITGVKKQLAWRGRTYDAAGTAFGGKSRVSPPGRTDNGRGARQRGTDS